MISRLCRVTLTPGSVHWLQIQVTKGGYHSLRFWIKWRHFQTILNESRDPVGLTPACSDCQTTALCLTLKMWEKCNVKLSILYNKYDFVDPSFLKLGRCLDLCPEEKPLHWISFGECIKPGKFDGKIQKKMPNEVRISWKLKFVCNHLLAHSHKAWFRQDLCALSTLIFSTQTLMCGLENISVRTDSWSYTYLHFQLLFCSLSS